ncbi:hypothetical protein L195_g037760 [Trifolium pratense]|uniref:Uncharacterized protein n=1 Tax=Trifolium pratense TaxID=57577 RepID=A0A2K3LT60_TRIPR|nr:hypothetical protein L195_g037760 [Trifolium pratense]
MSSSSVAHTTTYQIPKCGCNKTMRMFISNSSENPKRKYWKYVHFRWGLQAVDCSDGMMR